MDPITGTILALGASGIISVALYDVIKNGAENIPKIKKNIKGFLISKKEGLENIIVKMNDERNLKEAIKAEQKLAESIPPERSRPRPKSRSGSSADEASVSGHMKRSTVSPMPRTSRNPHESLIPKFKKGDIVNLDRVSERGIIIGLIGRQDGFDYEVKLLDDNTREGKKFTIVTEDEILKNSVSSPNSGSGINFEL